MRHIYLVVLMIIPFCSNAQQGISWEPEITVADGATYGNIRPRLALTNDDTPVVVFGKPAGGELFVARGAGATFNVPVAILPAGLDSYLANWTGPDIGADGDNVVVVFKAEPYLDGNIYAVRSTDGGVTFSDTIRVDDYDLGQTWMPALDMDDAGNPQITYMTFDASGGDERIAVVSSLDGGLTYQPQQVVTASTSGVACDCCPPEMIANGAYRMAIFRNNISNIRDSWASLSEDSGATYNSSENLDLLNWMITSCPSTGPAGIIIGDSAYVVSASKGAGGNYRVYVSTTGLAGGLNLASVDPMDPPTDGPADTQNFPRISGVNDTLVMVWEEKEGPNSEIMCAVTTDGSAQSLASYKSRVNSVLTGFQGKPDVIYQNGYVHVVFQDYLSGDLLYRRGQIVDVTGFGEEAFLDVELYPNPAKNSVNLVGTDLNEIAELHLINSVGETVKISYEFHADGIAIDLTSVESAGLYILEVVGTNGSSIREQIVIQK